MSVRLRPALSSPRFRLAALGAALALIATLSPRPAAAFNCTLQVCPVINPCPGTIIKELYCCPPGTNVVCFYAIDGITGCVRSVSGFCR
jgi:predicted Abi (CAAX) family protease